jgi:hypothetical protein
MRNTHSSLALSLAALGLFTACAISGPDAHPGSGSDPGQQFEPDVAKNTTGGTSDPRVFWCALEYETFSPAFETGNIGYISTTFGNVVANGATAADQSYELYVASNTGASTNLSLNIALYGLSPSPSQLSYAVLPAPKVTGPNDYLFEIGSPITPQAGTAYDGTTQTFDYVRAYCRIQNPSS